MATNYTVLQLKTDLENSLHGTTLNKVQGVNQIIERAGSQLLLELDPMETIRIVTLGTPIYNQVYDYPLPDDLKGTKIIDIRPQANRTLLDRYLQQYNQDFSINKSFTLQPNFTINFVNGVKFVRIDNNLLLSGIQLNQADTINGNGVWTTGGNATNLEQDNVNFVVGASSLEFDITNSGTEATLENSNMTPVDLTTHLNQSQLFFYTYLPTALDFGSVELRWGSSATDYWSQTLTTTNIGTAFHDGWNLLEANWVTATMTGAPDVENVNYIKVIWNYDGVQQFGTHLNSIYSRLGTLVELEYYSKYLFRNATTGAFQQSITDNSNYINLDVETRDLIYFLTGLYATQQVQGLDGMFFDANYFEQKYQRALAMYKSQYKSQWQKPRSSYYNLPNPSNQNWGGGNRYNY